MPRYKSGDSKWITCHGGAAKTARLDRSGTIFWVKVQVPPQTEPPTAGGVIKIGLDPVVGVGAPPFSPGLQARLSVPVGPSRGVQNDPGAARRDRYRCGAACPASRSALEIPVPIEYMTLFYRTSVAQSVIKSEESRSHGAESDANCPFLVSGADGSALRCQARGAVSDCGAGRGFWVWVVYGEKNLRLGTYPATSRCPSRSGKGRSRS